MKKILLAAALAALGGGAAAQAADTALRICAADDEMPYANARGEGFEDRIAAVLAQTLGAPLERVGFTDPRFVVRDLVGKGKCDVMIGVDHGDPRLETTRPYYRSHYVFLTREADQLDVRDWSSPVLKRARVGAIPGTPAETMLIQLGRYPDMFSYLMSLGGNKSMRNRYVKYDVAKLVKDLADGQIDVAVAWAPAVARHVKASTVALNATPVPDAAKSNGQPVVFTYDTSVGVAKGNTALLARVQAALDQAAPRIRQVLEDEGIPALAPALSSVAARSEGAAQ